MVLTQAEYDKAIIEYNKAKAQYDKDKAVYDQAMAKYLKEKEVYDKATAGQSVDNSKGPVGTLSKNVAQTLIFKSEPDAKITSFTTTGELIKDSAGIRRHVGEAYGTPYEPHTLALIDVFNKTGRQAAVLYSRRKHSAKVVYEGLKNSTMGGVKVAKVVYTYNITKSTAGKSVIIPEPDPTKTVWFTDGGDGKSVDFKVTVEFFDEKGQKIKPSGLVSFASLNSNLTSHEYVDRFSGEMIAINGSSIEDNHGKWTQIRYGNDHIMFGSKYNSDQWDRDGSPLEYYGAVAGLLTGDEISFHMGSVARGYVWFTFNSEVKAKVLSKPIEPKAPVEPIKPEAPIPYDDTPPPPPPPEPEPECKGCDCELTTDCEKLARMADEMLRDFASRYKYLETCDLAEEGAKGFHTIWCLLKSLIAIVCLKRGKSAVAPEVSRQEFEELKRMVDALGG